MDEALQTLLGIIQNGGQAAIAAVFAIMWWLERIERRSAQEERNALLERVLSAMSTTALSMDALVAGTERRDDALSSISSLLNVISGGLQTLAIRDRRRDD